MKTYTEKRPCIGGGFNEYRIEETSEWKSQQLGTELTEKHNLVLIECDHYDDEDAEGIKVNGNRWLKKSLVSRVFWQLDPVTNTRVLARIEAARPISI